MITPLGWRVGWSPLSVHISERLNEKCTRMSANNYKHLPPHTNPYRGYSNTRRGAHGMCFLSPAHLPAWRPARGARTLSTRQMAYGGQCSAPGARPQSVRNKCPPVQIQKPNWTSQYPNFQFIHTYSKFGRPKHKSRHPPYKSRIQHVSPEPICKSKHPKHKSRHPTYCRLRLY